jgi:hypothetical protein
MRRKAHPGSAALRVKCPHPHRRERAVTAAQIDQIWRPPGAGYMHRFGRA